MTIDHLCALASFFVEVRKDDPERLSEMGGGDDASPADPKNWDAGHQEAGGLLSRMSGRS